MIAFDSPEGAALRALKPSRSATLSIWLTALREGEDGWMVWARDTVGQDMSDAEIVALRYMQAASDRDKVAMHQLWVVLDSFPTEAGTGPAVKAARELRASLPT